METDMLVEIFFNQRQFQQRLGYNFDTMTEKQQIAYIKEMYIALVAELHEAIDETTWKSWAEDSPGINDHEAYGYELVDALHFLLNLFMVAGWGPEQIYDAYLAKMKVNNQRQDGGYRLSETKCSWCRRALDEPYRAQDRTVSMTPVRDGHLDHIWCDDICYTAWSQVHDKVAEETLRTVSLPDDDMITLVIDEGDDNT